MVFFKKGECLIWTKRITYLPLNPSVYVEQFVSNDLWYNLILVRGSGVMWVEKRLILKHHFKAENKCGLEERKDVAWWLEVVRWKTCDMWNLKSQRVCCLGWKGKAVCAESKARNLLWGTGAKAESDDEHWRDTGEGVQGSWLPTRQGVNMIGARWKVRMFSSLFLSSHFTWW